VGANVDYWVTASVSEHLSPFFARVIGATGATVAASATGGIVLQTGAGGCIYALDNSMAAALQVGASSLSSTCGIFVNSNNSGALKVNGANSSVQATSNSGINIVGGWTCTSGCTGVSPTPTTGVSPASDPLATLPPVTFSGCDQVNWSQSSTNANSTLNPGTYCGGIKISGGSVTLRPGTYVLNGGGLSITGNNTTVTGSGVLFYNTSSGYTVGNLSISGQPSVTLTAPTSGTYQGILYFRDRTMCPSTNDTVLVIPIRCSAVRCMSTAAIRMAAMSRQCSCSLGNPRLGTTWRSWQIPSRSRETPI
jgi:hypothetical protein